MKKMQLVARLKQLAKAPDYEWTIKHEVANDAMHAEDEISYLQDVVNHGCESGTCMGLIYYADTHAFYAKYADECDDILNEYEESTGEGFKFKGQDVRNTLAWMGYEERARELLDQLDA